jgi:large subunit ribosomal protein L13
VVRRTGLISAGTFAGLAEKPVSFHGSLATISLLANPTSPILTREFEMPTYSPKASEITRAWHVIDAEGLVLGRMCTEAARVLRGKHKPIFAPHIDTGDHVVVVNASKVVLTKDKAANKGVYRYSGYPGGLKTESYEKLLGRKPEEAIRRSIQGMLPKGPLGRQMIKKLKVYAGPEHPHAAQLPVVLDLAAARAR